MCPGVTTNFCPGVENFLWSLFLVINFMNEFITKAPSVFLNANDITLHNETWSQCRVILGEFYFSNLFSIKCNYIIMRN